MRQIPLGAKGTFTLRVLPEHLANQFKDAMLPQVLATPVMILIMENAALNAIRAFLEFGESAIGTKMEDDSEKHIAMENRLYPMRELLGDLLLEQQQPGLALTEYETSLVSTPNRLRGLYGAAKAAKAANQPEKATAYFRKLAEMTKDADADRVEISEAKASLMQQ
jgi:hypothetical protein